jgi:hypothetical protein
MYVGAPFGLKPLSTCFQAVSRAALRGCEAFTLVFVDNIVVFSNTMRTTFAM